MHSINHCGHAPFIVGIKIGGLGVFPQVLPGHEFLVKGFIINLQFKELTAEVPYGVPFLYCN